MSNRFTGAKATLNGPAIGAFPITPNDGADLADTVKGIYVGGTGDVTVVTLDGQTVTFKAVPVGVTINIIATRVMATNTTATLLTGLY